MTGRRAARPQVPAGLKLGLLAAAGTAVFVVTDGRLLAGALLGSVGLMIASGAPWRDGLAAWRGPALILALVMLAQGLAGDWTAGLTAVLRIATLMLLATTVTLTTRASDMTDAIAAGLRPLRRLGTDPEAVALALSLAVRLLPLLAAEAATVRDAQRARGLDRHPLALFVPLIVRALKLADDLAEAIDARSGGSGPGDRRRIGAAHGLRHHGRQDDLAGVARKKGDRAQGDLRE